MEYFIGVFNTYRSKQIIFRVLGLKHKIYKLFFIKKVHPKTKPKLIQDQIIELSFILNMIFFS